MAEIDINEDEDILAEDGDDIEGAVDDVEENKPAGFLTRQRLIIIAGIVALLVVVVASLFAFGVFGGKPEPGQKGQAQTEKVVEKKKRRKLNINSYLHS